MRIEGKVVGNLSIIDLNEGDVFAKHNAYDEDYLYMKTDSQDNKCEDVDVNAVRLANGQLVWIDEDEKIYLVDGSFVIRG